MNIAEVVADKIIADNRAELDRIEKLDDMIEQGYQAAPYIIKGLSVTPREFALHMVSCGELNSYNAERNLGAIKWCLEQMAKEELQ